VNINFKELGKFVYVERQGVDYFKLKKYPRLMIY